MGSPDVGPAAQEVAEERVDVDATAGKAPAGRTIDLSAVAVAEAAVAPAPPASSPETVSKPPKGHRRTGSLSSLFGLGKKKATSSGSLASELGDQPKEVAEVRAPPPTPTGRLGSGLFRRSRSTTRIAAPEDPPAAAPETPPLPPATPVGGASGMGPLARARAEALGLSGTVAKRSPSSDSSSGEVEDPVSVRDQNRDSAPSPSEEQRTSDAAQPNTAPAETEAAAAADEAAAGDGAAAGDEAGQDAEQAEQTDDVEEAEEQAAEGEQADDGAAPADGSEAAAKKRRPPLRQRLERARSAAAKGLAVAISGADGARAAAEAKAARRAARAAAEAAAGAAAGTSAAPTSSDDATGPQSSSDAPASARAYSGAYDEDGPGEDAAECREYSPEDYEAAAAARRQSAAAADRVSSHAIGVPGAGRARSVATEAETPRLRETSVRKFPKGFMWGTGSHAYSIEGAYLDDGKGMSIWDAFTHADGRIADGSNADVSACHYYRYKEDVALLRNMGVKYYRLSISWSRIFPNGKGKVNERGVAFYDRLISELISNRIMPIVTLYAWDLPLSLQLEEDGWLNPRTADHFAKYAKLCFSRFGDRVKYWITFNDPWGAAVKGHDTGGCAAPGRSVDPATEVYKAAHNMLLAHAKAYDTYARVFKGTQRGRVGIALAADWYEAKPAASRAERQRNEAAAERALEFTLGFFARPIYQGDYPAVMRERVGNRLPRFTREQREMLKGACDFLGLNHYASHLCEQPGWHEELGPAKEGGPRIGLIRMASHLIGRGGGGGGGEIQEGGVPDSPGRGKLQPNWWKEERDLPHPDPYIESGSYWQDMSVDRSDDATWKTTAAGLAVHPEGLRRVLAWVQAEFAPRGGIIITENGVATQEGGADGARKDRERALYLKRYLTEVHRAIVRDAADVRGYFVWSLLDGFDWSAGFSHKYGLHHVDFATLERTPKLSAHWYSEVLRRNKMEV